MEKQNISELVKQTKIAMQRLSFSDKTINCNSRIFEELIEFALNIGESEFSEKIGEQFLLKRYGYTSEKRTFRRRDLPSKTVCAIQRLSFQGMDD